jgi:hypothetical protein
MNDRLPLTYILPVKKTAHGEDDDLESYVHWLDPRVELIVVDASDDAAFDAHALGWKPALHIRPDPSRRTANGKVWGVLTGLDRASHDRVVVADDDVRYDEAGLARVMALLDRAEVVRPQNYFSPAPWHAQWDSGRSLLNRMTGGDWPGTLAFRRAYLPSGYDGDCLFENLELVRTVRAAGGRELVDLGVYVKRRPPTARHFLSQRVRQAYDEWARPWRLAVQLALLPALLLALWRRPALVPAGAAVAMLVAEAGRLRADGTRFFSPLASLMAPLWLAERMVCVWVAFATRVTRGGVRYHGAVIGKAATPMSELERRVADLPIGGEAA